MLGFARLILRFCISPSVCPSLYPWEVFPCPWLPCLFPVDASQDDRLAVPGAPQDAPQDDRLADQRDDQRVLALDAPPVSVSAPGVPSGDPPDVRFGDYRAVRSVGLLNDPQDDQPVSEWVQNVPSDDPRVSVLVPGVPSDDLQVDPRDGCWAAHSVCQDGLLGDSQAALRSAALPDDHSAVHSDDCPAVWRSASLQDDPLACFQVARRLAAVSLAARSGDSQAAQRSAARH